MPLAYPEVASLGQLLHPLATRTAARVSLDASPNLDHLAFAVGHEVLGAQHDGKNAAGRGVG
jgi:hypothetical protein